MPANPTTLHIPVVFDVSGGATLFAESQPEDFVENHLQSNNSFITITSLY